MKITKQTHCIGCDTESKMALCDECVKKYLARQRKNAPQYPTIHKHADGGYVWTDCPECGPNVAIDSEGLCFICGSDALYYGREPERPETCLVCAKELVESELRMANGEYYTMDELKAALLDGEDSLFPEVIRMDDLPEGCELRWAERDKDDFYSFPVNPEYNTDRLHHILIIPPVKS